MIQSVIGMPSQEMQFSRLVCDECDRPGPDVWGSNARAHADAVRVARAAGWRERTRASRRRHYSPTCAEAQAP